MQIPEPVRRLALQPFRELPVPPGIKQFRAHGIVVSIDKGPGMALVHISGDDVEDLEAAVEHAREAARKHDKQRVVWWIAPEHDRLGPRLAALGIVNQDTPGFEATENALALVEPPAGERPTGVDVRVTESWDDYQATAKLSVDVFGTTPIPEPVLRELYEDYTRPDYPGREFVASLDGQVVGKAYAALGDAGMNLFGGAVLPEARGHGVYRALLFARWDFAVERGTPALTVQAGRMSRPICERMGFQFVDAAHIYVDELS